MGKRHSRATLQWRTIDLHIHTPASSDYQQPEVTYLDILQKAELRGLDMMAITDHNTVSGYRRMMEEVEQLTLLEKLDRMLPEERTRLNEYQRLFKKIVVLPGFEFTATFGFHILAVFGPGTTTREMEHLLRSLGIQPEQIDEGAQNVGATADVLTAYRQINDAGGLVIAAHANSSNGVAMRGFNFGGQTKIAYTQDPNLHALEVTDLEQKGPRTTAAFFNGTKPEYPRRMHCIQGSDAHRLAPDTTRRKNLSIGERATDVLLSEVSFEALRELLQGNDFSRTRPHRFKEEPAYDFLQTALDEGSNIIQEFHESMTIRGGQLYAILADVCAFANTNGGTLYIGLNGDPKKPPAGVANPDQGIKQIEKEVSTRISPPLQVTFDTHEIKNKKIIRVLVPRGTEPPYAVDDNKIYVRDEAETGLAVRDEIVSLVLRSRPEPQPVDRAPAVQPNRRAGGSDGSPDPAPVDTDETVEPRTGVEVLPPMEREGKLYYTMRDLRNGNVVKNVTRGSARRLWHYAIKQHSEIAPNLDKASVTWQGEFGLIKKYNQGKTTRYDLIQRTSEGTRYFFGVTQDGIHGPWKNLVGEE